VSIIAVALVVFAVGAMSAVIKPERGLQDRLAGTWLVPREILLSLQRHPYPTTTRMRFTACVSTSLRLHASHSRLRRPAQAVPT